jgi:hypothetical protein
MRFLVFFQTSKGFSRPYGRLHPPQTYDLVANRPQCSTGKIIIVSFNDIFKVKFFQSSLREH